MKRTGVLVLAAVVLFACHREAPAQKRAVQVTTTNIPSDVRNAKGNALIRPTGRFLQSSRLGTKLGADGVVAEETATFGEGEAVYLTLSLRESPAGLQTHAVWLDAGNREIGKELHAMNGTKVVTFAMTKRLAPGRYRVEAYWGGNLAADKAFEVIARPAKKKGR